MGDLPRLIATRYALDMDARGGTGLYLEMHLAGVSRVCFKTS